MRTTVALILLFLCSSVIAANSTLSFTEAKKIWEASKSQNAYGAYATEFAQFNNAYQLDTKNGCYALGSEPVQLMLVITHRGNGQGAVIEQALSNVQSAKSACFEKSYIGVPVKEPPFLPFVLQMGMG